MSTDAGSRAIASAAVGLGHELGLHVVAEGVETAVDWERVRTIGCDSVQGYFVARPMDPAALFAWATDHDDGFMTQSRSAAVATA